MSSGPYSYRVRGSEESVVIGVQSSFFPEGGNNFVPRERSRSPGEFNVHRAELCSPQNPSEIPSEDLSSCPVAGRWPSSRDEEKHPRVTLRTRELLAQPTPSASFTLSTSNDPSSSGTTSSTPLASPSVA